MTPHESSKSRGPTLDAGFISGLRLPGAPPYPKVAVARDVPITMRDGVRLYADVHRPADAAGRPVEEAFPVVLVQTPYNKRLMGETLDGVLVRDVVRHGYVQVVVDVRGTGGAFGAWELFGPEERKDYLETAEWAVSQPFSNGRLGLYGPSYLGIAALLTAGQRPRGLGALFVIATTDHIVHDLYRGGDIPYLIDVGLVLIIKALGLAPPGYALRRPLEALKFAACRLGGFGWPIQAARSLLSDGDIAYNGPFFDAFSPGAQANRIEAPTFLMGGWFDLYQRGMPETYRKLSLPPGRKQLLMGPWDHIIIGRGLGGKGAPPPLQTLALMWFDRWLKDIDNGIDRFGPVTVNQLGVDRWASYPDFPRPTQRWRRLYLGPEGLLTDEPPAREGADRRRAHLLNGWFAASSTQWSAGGLRPRSGRFDNRFVEARGLTYTTQPLTRRMHISGPISLTLRGATTGRDANWIVTLSDVAPDGRSTRLTGGALLQSMRALDESATRCSPEGEPIAPQHPYTRESRLPVTPGEPETLQIEIFNVDAVIRRGHRLRLAVLSSDLPTLGPTPPRMRGRAGTISVHYGPSEPSYLLLPIENEEA